MIVECRPFRPLSGGKEVDGGQYRIFIDGKAEGFIGYHTGAVPMLLVRRSPEELKEIETQIARQLAPQQIGNVKQIAKDKRPVYQEVPNDDFD